MILFLHTFPGTKNKPEFILVGKNFSREDLVTARYLSHFSPTNVLKFSRFCPNKFPIGSLCPEHGQGSENQGKFLDGCCEKSAENEVRESFIH